jgi:hypothetical protein
MEKLALGQSLYSWDYQLVLPDDSEPTTGVYVGMATVDLPPREVCVVPVLAELKRKEDEIQAEAYQAVLEVQNRRNNLLAITNEVVNV